MERSVDKLARYIMYLAGAAAVCAVCWYFRSVLVYIILAAVVSLIGRPVKHALAKIRIKGKSLPDGLLAVLTLLMIVLIFLGIITQLIPVIYGIVQNISANMQAASYNATGLSSMLDNLNLWLISTFPCIGTCR